MPPRWRLPLLVLGFVALAFGVAGGLARVTPLAVPATALALHGPLMVSAFFGSVISLERAAALGRPWAYAAPLCAGLGGLCLLAGFATAGFALMVLAAAVFVLGGVAVMRRQPSLETATLLAGAAAWLAGNVMLLEGQAARTTSTTPSARGSSGAITSNPTSKAKLRRTQGARFR